MDVQHGYKSRLSSACWLTQKKSFHLWLDEDKGLLHLLAVFNVGVWQLEPDIFLSERNIGTQNYVIGSLDYTIFGSGKNSHHLVSVSTDT